MSAATVHFILLGLGLAWLAFVVLVHRRTTMGWPAVIALYGVALILTASGLGILPVPPVLVTP